MDYTVYLIDAIPFVVLAASILICKHRGFAGILLSVIAVTVCMYFASQYASPIAETFTAQAIHPRLVQGISEKLISGLANGKQSIEQMLPEIFTAYSDLNLKDAVTAGAVNGISESVVSGAEQAVIIPALTCLIFVLVYFIAKLISRIFIKAADLLLKLPIIRQANHGLGAVLGVVVGIILGTLSVMVLVTTSKFVPGTRYETLVSQATIIQNLYEKIQNII